jgi:glutathione S-transferase
MVIKLWGRLSSINVQKAVWALEELDLAYQRTDAGGAFGLNDTPEYLRMNPTGLVPTLEEDAFILWESNAIVRYLAAKYGAGTLWPENLRVRAEADRWMDWQATAFTPALRDGFWQLIRTPEEKRDPAVIERSLAASERNATILDRHLAGRAYVAGEAFTAGDIAAGAIAHRWLNMPIRREPRPEMERWYRELMRRPAAQRALLLPVA